MRSRIDAAPRGWRGLRVGLSWMLGLGIVCASASGAPAPKSSPASKPANTQAQATVQTPAASQAQPAAPGDFVGAESCATCHDAEAKGFGSNPHSKLAEEHGNTGVPGDRSSSLGSNTGVTCESCHGAGRAHVESGGDKTKIFDPATAPAKDVDKMCLGCHQGKHSNFERSAHGEANVSCIGCHTVHVNSEDPQAREHLLKAAQPTLCYQCHTDIKPQFSMAFHHKVDEGLVQCSDCHDPHGTFERKDLKSASQQDAVCVKCHTETAGPFVYEHDVVKTEGCTACHTPHGGPNPRLLNRANVDTICLQCHSPSMNFTTGPPIGPSHNQAAQYQSCIICHTSIHGSNVSPIFFNSN